MTLLLQAGLTAWSLSAQGGGDEGPPEGQSFLK